MIFLQEAFWALNLACALIVALGTVASLASIASSIVVDKDWVAVIAVGDADFLARKSRFRSLLTTFYERRIANPLYRSPVSPNFKEKLD